MSCCSNNVTCSCANGIDGKNIWTLTTAQFTQPIVGGTVTISVSSTLQLSNQGFGIGQVVFIEGGGYYEVTAIPSLTTITVENLGYTGNAAPAVIVATGKKVSPGGLVGPSGSSGGNGTNGTTLLYNDNTPVVSGAGTPSVLHTYTVAAGELASNGDALKVKTVVTYTGTYSGTVAVVYLRVNGDNVILFAAPVIGNGHIIIDALISRVSATSLNVTSTAVSGFPNPAYVPSGVNGGTGLPSFAFESVAVLNLASNTFDIDVYEVRTDVTDTIESKYLTVEKLVI